MAGITITYPNDYVYYIVDKNSKYATVMKKNIPWKSVGTEERAFPVMQERVAWESMKPDTVSKMFAGT